MSKVLEVSFDKEVWMVERDSDHQKTGRTICVLWVGPKRYVGIAECSELDFSQFSKHRGRAIARSRAEHILAIDEGRKEARPKDSKNRSKHFVDRLNMFIANVADDGSLSGHVAAKDLPIWMLKEKEEEEKEA